MLATVEEAKSQVIDWWGDLPPQMKAAIEQFRTQLGAAIDSGEFVKRALDGEVHETDHGKDPALVRLWHKADMAIALSDVRFRGVKRTKLPSCRDV